MEVLFRGLSCMLRSQKASVEEGGYGRLSGRRLEKRWGDRGSVFFAEACCGRGRGHSGWSVLIYVLVATDVSTTWPLEGHKGHAKHRVYSVVYQLVKRTQWGSVKALISIDMFAMDVGIGTSLEGLI
ncbi:hypothetical protein BDU57DRAFT_168935 [Ampelomyces quisqualis]|uniref:Uncharacterized protein n=1 Tax=Ampelomyces quisqualis TaxID=50730 RepID=A0A6A5QRT6_AMPQU|nr:hypothetical protein BDU57DRAFT_168935 [Ampelomyces quisqualis]